MPGTKLAVSASMNHRQDRIRGALLGTFIGDAFGLPFEGTPTKRLDALADQLERRAKNPRYWGYSDDTEMMISVGESLVEQEIVDPEHIFERLRTNFDPGRGYGKALRLKLTGCPDAPTGGTEWRSRGCGASVRVAPIGALLADTKDAEKVTHAAIETARLTHESEEAVNGSVIQAHAVASLIRLEGDFAPSLFLKRLQGVVLANESPFIRRLRWIAENQGSGFTRDQVIERLGCSPLAIEAVPAALCSFLHSPRNLVRALLFACGLGGDTDSIGALTGALVGSLVGMTAFPAGWISALEDGPKGRSHVLWLADQLCAIS